MNFIAASLLLHSDEVIAFTLFEYLLNECKLRDVYVRDLEGLYRHCKIIEVVLIDKIPELYEHLSKHDI